MDTRKNVTLCAIDTENPVLALRALDVSMQAMSFGAVLFFTDRPEAYRLPGCRMIGIPRLTCRSDYSRFVTRSLGGYVDTSHALLVQWDGYVVNADCWSDEFLACDYIGAPWGFHHDAFRVGNGGFSLRSRRLLDALADPEITDVDPEDEAICRRYRPLLESRYGISFAPESLAARFSFETTYPEGPTLGFHGLFNMWMFLHPQELADFVTSLSPRTVAGRQFLRLGKNYLELGRRDEAETVLKRRLEVVPGDEEARRLLATSTARPAAAARRNDPCPCGSGKRYKHCCGKGETSVGSVVSPPTAEAILGEAMRHHQAGRLADADALYGQVLRLDPANAYAKQYLGVLAMQRGDARQGEALIREALAGCSEIPDFHNNLGLCLRMQDRLDEAVDAYRKAIALNPNYPEAYSNLGLDLLALGQPATAAAHCERALALRPQFAEAHWNLGLARLTLGDLATGWQEYEWRLRCQPFTDDGLLLRGVAMWQGEPLEGKTLLVRREQGFGDTLQFLRLVPELVRRGARVLLDVSPEIADLARTISPAVELVVRGSRLPTVDYYTNLLSLPFRLRTTLADLPGTVPYLRVDAERLAAWTERFADVPGRRIGLVWAGSPKHKNDLNRSCPLSRLSPLLELPGLSWFSLQKGAAAAQLADLPPGRITDLGPELHTFSDTAAAIQALDLVIAVDTSVVHLAGALGRPAWVLLPHAPDWRWLLKREDSPWYPSLRLFRAASKANWASVVGRVMQALEP
jgi:tetratricopeptide (TPR) repeat protein